MRQIENKKRLTSTQKDYFFAYACIAPAVISLGFIIFAPIVKAIYMSFMDYRLNTTDPPVWNQFENYISLFESGEVGTYTFNTIIYMFFSVSIQFILAMVIALLLNRNIPARGLFRSFFMLPWIVPTVVTSMLWSWQFNPQYGVLNYLLHTLGFQENLNQLWVQDPVRAMVCIVIATVWKNTPYTMLMLLAGLQSIDVTLHEAASIDGANGWQNFFHVTIPSLRPVIDSTMVIALVGTAQMFTVIYNMTGGGPMNKTTTFAMAAYNKAFVEFDLGAGSTLGVIWLVILGIIIGIYKHISDKKTSSYM